MSFQLPGCQEGTALADAVGQCTTYLSHQSPRLRTLPVEERILALVHWATAWTQPKDPYRLEALSVLPATTGLSEAMVAWGLDVAFESVEAHRLRTWWEREGAERTSTLPSAHIASSNVFAACLPPVIASLLAGVPVFLRPPKSQPDFAVLLARSWNERGLLGGSYLAAATWDRADQEVTAALLRGADPIYVFGEDNSVQALRSRVRELAPDSRLLGFGHRLSVAALGKELLDEPGSTVDALESLAVDCLAWDGAGCLTPRWVFVEGSAQDAVDLAKIAAPILARVAEELPAGRSLDAADGAARAGWLGQAGFEGWSRQGSGWAVGALAEARLDPVPPLRSLAFLPLDDLSQLSGLLRPLGPHLQGLAYGGSLDRRKELASSLAEQGLSRVVRPGFLQRPPVDWNHDDVRILADLF